MSDAADGFGYPVVDLPTSAISSPELVVRFLVEHMVQAERLPSEEADRVICRVFRREAVGSTNVGHGFALPHSKSEAVDEVVGIVGRSTIPVAWPGPANWDPVRVICLLITPVSKPTAALRALEVVAQQMKGE